MDKIFHDNHYGTITSVFYDEDNQRFIEDTREDVTAHLESIKRKQNATSDWKKFNPNQEYHMVLDLTMTDVMTLMNNEGIDMLSNEIHWPELFKIIDTKYPYMKTTTAKLA